MESMVLENAVSTVVLIHMESMLSGPSPYDIENAVD